MIYNELLKQYGLSSMIEKKYITTLRNMHELRDSGAAFKVFSYLLGFERAVLVNAETSKQSQVMQIQQQLEQDGEQVQFFMNLLTQLDDSKGQFTFQSCYTSLEKVRSGTVTISQLKARDVHDIFAVVLASNFQIGTSNFLDTFKIIHLFLQKYSHVH